MLSDKLIKYFGCALCVWSFISAQNFTYNNFLSDTLNQSKANSIEVADINNVNKQLLATITSLRDKLERKDAQRIEEIQRVEIQKRDEHKELVETIIILRKKLEERGGKRKK